MIHTHTYDALVVGGGGAGLMAAIYLSREQGIKTAVISKLYPTRSHTGAAQGGICAALANLEEDHPEWHAFDTVKGSDYLGDQDAIETMCREAVDVVIELEHMGLPFSRTLDGKIAQRPFGGHTHHFGQGPVRRSCYAADRTGHMILQTLYQNCIKNGVEFFDEFQVVDVMLHEGRCVGVVAYEVATGDLHVFRSKAVNFTTGGFGRVWSITSNAHANTGDGPAVAREQHDLGVEARSVRRVAPRGGGRRVAHRPRAHQVPRRAREGHEDGAGEDEGGGGDVSEAVVDVDAEDGHEAAALERLVLGSSAGGDAAHGGDAREQAGDEADRQQGARVERGLLERAGTLFVAHGQHPHAGPPIVLPVEPGEGQEVGQLPEEQDPEQDPHLGSERPARRGPAAPSRG